MDDEDDEDEEGYRLQDISSDVEIDPDEMDIPSDEDDSQCVPHSTLPLAK